MKAAKVFNKGFFRYHKEVLLTTSTILDVAVVPDSSLYCILAVVSKWIRTVKILNQRKAFLSTNSFKSNRMNCEFFIYKILTQNNLKMKAFS